MINYIFDQILSNYINNAWRSKVNRGRGEGEDGKNIKSPELPSFQPVSDHPEFESCRFFYLINVEKWMSIILINTQ